MVKKKYIPLITVLLILVFIAVVAFLVINYKNLYKPTVKNFASCVAAGYPVMESYPRQCSANGKTFVEIIDDSDSVKEYFVDKIWIRASENLGAMPVEGFDPELYKGAFPKLIDSDFDNAKAISGRWNFANERLSFIRDSSGDITSADGTLTREGVKTLLDNLIIRFDLNIETSEDINNLLDILSEENKNYCTQESRLAEACITLYKPVCGYFNQSIQCIKAPCANTYSNSCYACLDPKVSYWTEGECKT